MNKLSTKILSKVQKNCLGYGRRKINCDTGERGTEQGNMIMFSAQIISHLFPS